jgi:hypothetical protein
MFPQSLIAVHGRRFVSLITFLLILLVAAMLPAQPGHPGKGTGNTSWDSYARSKRYEFVIAPTDISKMPIWRDSDENPPLSARKALQIAKAGLADLVSDSKDWTLDTLSLQEVDRGHWVYLAAFQLFPKDTSFFGQPPTITIPVLMTGVAVKPKVTPWHD